MKLNLLNPEVQILLETWTSKSFVKTLGRQRTHCKLLPALRVITFNAGSEQTRVYLLVLKHKWGYLQNSLYDIFPFNDYLYSLHGSPFKHEYCCGVVSTAGGSYKKQPMCLFRAEERSFSPSQRTSCKAP